jgi:chemotaxis protein methyltransferase CheR
MVQYKPLNLLHNLSQFGTFDVVFCRNVLIYFDQDTKVEVLARLAKVMQPDGYLVLGAAETVVGLTDIFKPVPEQRGLYAPNGPGRTAARATPLPTLAAPRVAAFGTR